MCTSLDGIYLHPAAYYDDLCVQVYALVTSEQSPMTEIPGQEQDGSEARQPLERDPLFVAPFEDIFHLQLFSPASWEAVPNTK